ncbi:hypothetical protein AG1IA_00188 [Rhizoctonia solani AG-1 IA]|uniref:Uncharacterized protein n=1 Tax=Thanatephorus cucumeris (strain AG1-IA) TaxID=983506 RepID=L8X6H9_THACA|nr:hypothetical protein AG1IA_00188 [Rhizoctonia solani AG-1 IA]
MSLAPAFFRSASCITLSFHDCVSQAIWKCICLLWDPRIIYGCYEIWIYN